MADMADHAQTFEERERAAGIARTTQRHRSPTPVDPLRYCVSCGGEIAAKRVLAVPDCKLCVDCQTQQEGRQ